MEPLIIELTDSTPAVYLDKTSGKFEISGKSLPEEALVFYEPVLNWIRSYLQTPNNSSIFVFRMDYINSASVRSLNDILTLLEKMFLMGYDIRVDWMYNMDDNELRETGEEFSEIFKVPFRLEGYIEN